MRILFIHQNLPGQFRHLLAHYADRQDCDVVGLGERRRMSANFKHAVPGVRLVGYDMPECRARDLPLPLKTTEEAVRRGHVVLAALLKLKHSGFVPDVVYAHPGWGETIFLKDVFSKARLIHFCEFYYGTAGRDFDFDPEFPNSAEDILRVRIRNMHHLASAENADIGIAPTHWQRSVFPAVYRPRIEVVHDGVDTELLCPDRHAFIEFPSKGVRLTGSDEVVTFVSRNLEPYRGFHTFMRSLPSVLRNRPKLHVVIVGGDGVSYGRPPAEGSWREWMLKELGTGIDHSRVHFTGSIPYAKFVKILQVSTAHVYLTYPFVLSWSMMEAMAVGCVVIGSKTAPVQEVIEHGSNGILVDFFTSGELSDAIDLACSDRLGMDRIRREARMSIKKNYDLRTVCLPRQRRIIESKDVFSSSII